MRKPTKPAKRATPAARGAIAHGLRRPRDWEQPHGHQAEETPRASQRGEKPPRRAPSQAARPSPTADPMARLQEIARRAMALRGLLPDYSREAQKQLRSITAPAAASDPAIRDLRSLLWCSIDNDDSRDLDQLTAAEPRSAGLTRIWVAIADVDALVPQGTPIDAHASANTTSVYTAAAIFSMLPERLSTDLTSLNEGQDRLAMVIEMDVARDGSVKASAVYRGLVRNHAKLTYDAVAAWLNGTATAPPALTAVPGLDAVIRLQDQVAQALKGLRHQRGALSLESSESRPVFDAGVLANLRVEQTNCAKQLIEDFMIAANGVTAQFLEQRGFPSVRRVLRAPERWARLQELAASLDVRLPSKPSAKALEEFLQKRRKADPTRFADLSLSVVKLLGRGEYALELPGRGSEGHFGLAVKDYAHSTAPNRRFPDLLAQRLLKAALAGKPMPYSADELRFLADHCTRMEDNATKVERQVRKSAAALLLSTRIGESFDGIITGASDKGTYVRVVEPAAEGMIIRGFAGLDVGDPVRVTLLATDVERGFIDFARAR